MGTASSRGRNTDMHGALCLHDIYCLWCRRNLCFGAAVCVWGECERLVGTTTRRLCGRATTEEALIINSFSHQSGARSIIFQSRQRFGVIQRRLAYVGLQSRPSKQPGKPFFGAIKQLNRRKLRVVLIVRSYCRTAKEILAQLGCFAMVWTRLVTNACTEDPQYWTGIPFGHVLPK